MNARYYDPSRGQFLTEDPVFWSSKQNLANPQSLNSYSYANDNPISGKDPDGLSAQTALLGVLSRLQAVLLSLLTLLSQPSFVTYGQAAQTGFANASHPVQSAQSTASGVYSYAASTGSALKTIGRSDIGDFLLGQHAADLLLLLALKDVPAGAEGDAVSGGSLDFPTIKSGSAGSQTAGKAFANSVKEAARSENPTATCVFCHVDGSGTTVDHAIPRNSGGNALLTMRNWHVHTAILRRAQINSHLLRRLVMPDSGLPLGGIVHYNELMRYTEQRYVPGEYCAQHLNPV